MRRVAILLLVVGLAVTASAEQVRFTIHSQPSGATVVDHAGNELGVTGRPISAELPSQVQLTLKLEDYQSQAVHTTTRQLQDHQRFPEVGVISLVPNSRWIAVRDHLSTHKPWYLTLVLLVVLAVSALWSRRTKELRRLAKAEHLAALREKSESDASLLMQTLGGYRLVDELGRGGMATVYLGVPESKLGTEVDESDTVAVKVLAREIRGDARNQARFQREIKLCAGLDHPGIVKLLAFGEYEGMDYLVMERVQGQTLNERIPSEGLTLTEVVALSTQVLDAVHYANSQGVVHRDLKPSNIMVTQQGQVKVMDFGLARGQENDQLTRSGDTLGTPAYMAPEQIQARQVDARADQYALGLTLYEMCLGTSPWRDLDVMQVIMKQISTLPTPLSELKPEIPKSLSETIERMIAKDPEKRFEDLGRVSEALKTLGVGV